MLCESKAQNHTATFLNVYEFRQTNSARFLRDPEKGAHFTMSVTEKKSATSLKRVETAKLKMKRNRNVHRFPRAEWSTESDEVA